MISSNNKSLVPKLIDTTIIIITIVGLFKGALSMTLGLNINSVCLALACLSLLLSKNTQDTDMVTPIAKILICGILTAFSAGKFIPGNYILYIIMELFLRTLLIAFIVLKWIVNKIDALMH